MLSGGERKRISIARVVLFNPRVLLLDELTADLDAKTEKIVSEALVKLFPGIVTLIK
jgi:ABC-type multidrug transport system fused ATPase/permease subunit